MARARAGRRPGAVWIGTSGFVYRDWRGRFYPPGLPASRWLAHYAARFPTVELNSSFYRLPSARAFRAWRASVPPGFVFAVKASRYLTHIRRLRTPAAGLRRFLARARHLEAALGPVLFQLPPRFHASEARLAGLLAALARQRQVPALRVALEVRHPSWLVPPILEALRAANVALCFTDWREVPVAEPITADFVYVRRHGARGRYAGAYTRASLGADAERIRAWRAAGLDVYVYFNNDQAAAAVRNAATLAALLAPVPRAA
jgi:uncharacterized protein YecE (DUF72 family)